MKVGKKRKIRMKEKVDESAREGRQTPAHSFRDLPNSPSIPSHPTPLVQIEISLISVFPLLQVLLQLTLFNITHLDTAPMLLTFIPAHLDFDFHAWACFRA